MTAPAPPQHRADSSGGAPGSGTPDGGGSGPPDDPRDPTTLSGAEKAIILAGTLLGLLLAALDQTIVATAGPAIQADLDIDASLYAWLTTSYLVASTVMLPMWGKLADLFGRKPILVVGIAVFLIGSMACGLSGDTVQLIFARAVQGFGSAALFTSAFAVVGDLFVPAERGKYQGLLGGVFGVSSVLGPLVGGFITDHLGWHWVFFINVPVGGVALAFILLRMPHLHTRRRRPRLDVAGALALTVAVVPFLLALSLGRGDAAGAGEGTTGFPWGSWQILALFGLAVVGGAAFLVVERRVVEPLLDFTLFESRTFAVATLAAFVMGSGFLAAIVFLPLFMVNVVGLSNTASGFTITPLTLGVVAASILSGQLVSRLGRYRGVMLGSAMFLTLGYAVMGFTLSPESTQLELTVKMILVGLGLGPALPLFPLIAQNAVEQRRLGVATSSVTFARQLGSTMGVAVLGTVFGATLATGMASRLEPVIQEAPVELRGELRSLARGRPDALGGGAEEGAPVEGFSPENLRGLLRERGVDPSEAARLVDGIDAATKEAFTDAIERIYRFAILIGLLATLILLFLPEKPLRREEPS